MDIEQILTDISAASRDAFHQKQAVLSFREYLERLAAQPYALTRHSAAYIRDLFDYHGHYEVSGMGGKLRRWRLFDDPTGSDNGRVFGQEEVQNRLYEVFQEFVERGACDRFVLLHGPNGSAKSSLVDAIRAGLEHYSRREEAPLYRFSWIFCESTDRPGLGFQVTDELEAVESYAHVDESLITSRLPDEVRDPPWLLLPKQKRIEFIEQALQDAPQAERDKFRWNDLVKKRDLSPKNKLIYESLLRSYDGDWAKVMRHVRVERWFMSHRYRNGAVTIEPQGTIDANTRMLGHGQMSGLPPALQHETLLEAHGDLVDANGGIVEYSDFLKRNMEANKYLLTTAERGYVNLNGMTLILDLVLSGTTNEKFLVGFKRDPSFTSFKGRFELIRVPYLREYKKEAQIYQRHLERVCGGRHIAPHTATAAALWAVLTRLRAPKERHYDGPLKELVSHLTPLRKARLYDRGEIPPGLGEEGAKRLRGALMRIAHEFDGMEEEFEGYADASYEGRRGASPREMMGLLTDIAVESDKECLTPVDIFDGLPRLIEDHSLYTFLRIEEDEGYHDPEAFIELVRKEYLKHVATEIQKASDLVEETEYQRLFSDYVLHVRAFGTGEKLLNPQTGKYQPPDEDLMQRVEEHLGIDDSPREFRGNLMSKVAAFRLSNPDKPLVYEELFRDHFDSLERSFFNERKGKIISMVDDALEVHAGGGNDLPRERREAAHGLVEHLIRDFGYELQSVGHVLGYFQRHNQDLEA